MDRTIRLDNNKDIQTLFGKYDQNLRLIEKELNVRITRQATGLSISGERPQVDKTCDLFDYLIGLLTTGGTIKKSDITFALRLAQPQEGVDLNKSRKKKLKFSFPAPSLPLKQRDRLNMLTRSNITTLFLALARREQEKPIWPWRWRSTPLKRVWCGVLF